MQSKILGVKLAFEIFATSTTKPRFPYKQFGLACPVELKVGKIVLYLFYTTVVPYTQALVVDRLCIKVKGGENSPLLFLYHSRPLHPSPGEWTVYKVRGGEHLWGSRSAKISIHNNNRNRFHCCMTFFYSCR